MQLFYAADFTAPEYMLSEEESRHAVKVLRLAEALKLSHLGELIFHKYSNDSLL